MKQSSNSCKHTPAIQPYNPRNRTPVNSPCVVPVYERFSPLADLLRLVICALAAMLLVALLVPVAFAVTERDATTPVVAYIPAVATATEPVLTTTAEPVLTTAVAEAYTQEATDNTTEYYVLSTNEGNTLDKLSDAMVQMRIAVMTLTKELWACVLLLALIMLCDIAYSALLAKRLKAQVKELSDKIDTMSMSSDKP